MASLCFAILTASGLLGQTAPPPALDRGSGEAKTGQAALPEASLSAEDQLGIREVQLEVFQLKEALQAAEKRFQDTLTAVAKRNGCLNVGLRPGPDGKPQLVCIKPPETPKAKGAAPSAK